MNQPDSTDPKQQQERIIEQQEGVGSPEQGLESEQPAPSDDDVKRNINPSRTHLPPIDPELADE